MIFHRTLAVTNKLIKDIEKILYWTTIVVQCIFFAYYGYSIYSNLLNFTFLIIYSLLLVLSTLGFFKYVVNGSMLVLNLIEIIRYGGSNIAYTLIVLSSISLIIQIIVEFIRVFVSEYVSLYTIAIDKDTQFLRRIQDVKDVKGNFYGIVDAPLEVIAKKIKKGSNELSEKEKLVESLANISKTKKSNKRKVRHKENVKRQKEEIREHLNIIKKRVFKEKKKK